MHATAWGAVRLSEYVHEGQSAATVAPLLADLRKSNAASSGGGGGGGATVVITTTLDRALRRPQDLLPLLHAMRAASVRWVVLVPSARMLAAAPRDSVGDGELAAWHATVCRSMHEAPARFLCGAMLPVEMTAIPLAVVEAVWATVSAACDGGATAGAHAATSAAAAGPADCALPPPSSPWAPFVREVYADLATHAAFLNVFHVSVPGICVELLSPPAVAYLLSDESDDRDGLTPAALSALNDDLKLRLAAVAARRAGAVPESDAAIRFLGVPGVQEALDAAAVRHVDAPCSCVRAARAAGVGLGECHDTVACRCRCRGCLATSRAAACPCRDHAACVSALCPCTCDACSAVPDVCCRWCGDSGASIATQFCPGARGVQCYVAACASTGTPPNTCCREIQLECAVAATPKPDGTSDDGDDDVEAVTVCGNVVVPSRLQQGGAWCATCRAGARRIIVDGGGGSSQSTGRPQSSLVTQVPPPVAPRTGLTGALDRLAAGVALQAVIVRSPVFPGAMSRRTPSGGVQWLWQLGGWLPLQPRVPVQPNSVFVAVQNVEPDGTPGVVLGSNVRGSPHRPGGVAVGLAVSVWVSASFSVCWCRCAVRVRTLPLGSSSPT